MPDLELVDYSGGAGTYAWLRPEIIDACVVDGAELEQTEPNVDENGWHFGFVCKAEPQHYYRGITLGGDTVAAINEGEYDA